MVFGPASAATPAPSLSRPAVLASDALIVAPAPVPMAFTVIAGTPDATASVTMFSGTPLLSITQLPGVATSVSPNRRPPSVRGVSR